MIQTFAEESPIPSHLYRLFGTRTGIINNLADILPDPESNRGVAVTSSTARIGTLFGREGFDPPLRTGGKGQTLAEKTITCIGETVERYCSYWPAADAETASYAEMQRQEDVSVPDYDYLDIYDRGEHDDFAPFTRETPILWEQGTNILTGRPVMMPSGLVRANAGTHHDGVLFYGSSNGNAAGQSLLSTAVRSFLEVIERDAFMRTWCRQRSPPAVDLDDYPASRKLISEYVEDSAHEIVILELDSPFTIPTVGAVRYSTDGSFPSFAICAASALEPEAAVQEAVLETIQSEPFQRQARIDTDVEEIDIDEVMNLDDNFIYYTHPENFDDVSVLLASRDVKTELPTPPEPSTPRDELQYLCREFERVGVTPVLLDITTADVRDVGLRVTSGVVPELVGLSPPAALPKHHPVFEDETITTTPHPFP